MAASDGQTKTSMMTTAVIILLLTLTGAGAGLAVGVLVLPTPGEVAQPESPTPDAASSSTPENQGTGSATAPADSHATPDESDADEASEEVVVVDLQQYKVVPFPPIVTNLARPDGKWIRLEGAVLVRPGSEKAPEQLAEYAGEQILAYLRTVGLDQLEGPSGLLALRDDLNETVRTLSSGEVHSVLIHGLIVE